MKTDGHTFDVAIIGAGIAGISMAKAMADYGWRTILLDKHTFPRHKVCGEFLSPESARLFRALGCDSVLQSLNPSNMHHVRLILENGMSLEIPLPGTAFGISRYALDHALLQSAKMSGAICHMEAKVSGVSRDHGNYRLCVRRGRNNELLKARAVIGAWGRHRSVSLGRARTSNRKSFIGVKTHFEDIQSTPMVELYFFRGGYLGISPIEGTRYNVSALLSREAFQEAGKTVQGVIALAVRCNAVLKERLATGKPILGTEVAVAAVQPGCSLVPWDVVPHIGDAAAVIPPLCGDGMAMALRSAVICKHLAHLYLCGQLSFDVWRKQYIASLRREFVPPLRWGSVIEKLLKSPNLSPLLIRLGQYAPDVAYRFVQATRLNQSL